MQLLIVNLCMKLLLFSTPSSTAELKVPLSASLQGRYMAIDFDSDPLREMSYFWGLGIDGVFVDCPSTAREWLSAARLTSAKPTSWLRTIISEPGVPEAPLAKAKECSDDHYFIHIRMNYSGVRESYQFQLPVY